MPFLKLSYKENEVRLLGWLVLLPELVSTQTFYLIFPASCLLQFFKSLPASPPALELFPAPFSPVSSFAPYSMAPLHTHSPFPLELNALFLSADLPGLDCPHLDNLHSCISLHEGWHCSQEDLVSATEGELLHVLSQGKKLSYKQSMYL